MKIGILQCGHATEPVRERYGDYAEMFHKLLGGRNFDFQTYNVVDGEFPADVHEADGWLITGSRHGVYDDLEFIAPLEEFVRKAYDEGVPLVGICFGHQIIAQALGGRVEKFPEGWAIGHNTYEFDQLGPISLNAWHQDQVLQPPEGAETIAQSPFCRHAALVYGDKALTIQAHPEFTNEVIAEYVALRKGEPGYDDDVMDRAAKARDLPVDADKIADMIGGFFQKPRGKNV